MIKRIHGTVLAVLAFLLMYGLFPNIWLLGMVGNANAAWVGLFKLVAAGATAAWVYHRWSQSKGSEQG